MVSPVRAVHVALSWLTVVPLPYPRGEMDRRIGGAVIAATPVVGVLLGAVAAAVAAGLSHTDLPSALIGVLLMIILAGGTRGMHLDGLADTADGLGCYGPPQRVAEVMRSGSVGPFGVVAIVAVLGVQWTGFAALVDDHRYYEIALAVAVGRLAAVVGCRRGLTPAHADGFGSLVAGTQRASVAVWTLGAVGAALLVGLPALAGSPPSGSPQPTTGFAIADALTAVVAVLVVVAVAWQVTRHSARRAGGLTGDVLGAVIEIGTAIMLIGLLV
ncbi:adenosylcobinamide-GDP ribazoletransferase [Gordonia soli]|uniref:Adenosylcobinamide-GDP ribazoletransferase n=1 Tax=Gordonia soli NBRC 108243 TaxID=1223545 RepID=M0QLR4_9ACTN|nr:adenosylcobinamide-GDP ribazoletransferase [Gordonia soli]GAC69503.1 cobalamin synthase [Gordonia soli NBRC 108243]